ncbi:hypothetical protein D3C80_357320 [compost metagenome]
MSKPARRARPAPCPLLLIAGLPKETAEPAAQTVNNDRTTPWRAEAVAAPRDRLYSSQAIVDLMGQACAYAMTADTDEPIPNPSRIVLAYVAGDGADALLDSFGHSVMAVPLELPDWDWPNGLHWRFKIELVNMLVRRAMASAQTEPLEGLRLRLEAQSHSDPLLLPSRNFHLPNKEALTTRLGQVVHAFPNVTPVEEIDTVVTRKRWPKDRLKRFYAATGGKNKLFAVDQRGLVFAKAGVGQHGGDQDIPTKVELDQHRLRRELEGRFRLGTPLRPAGFQHDVQWPDDVQLVREPLECFDEGAVRVSGSHANIYGNDVIRAEKVEREK